MSLDRSLAREPARIGVLMAAFAAANIGIWNAGVPIGDEGIHVLAAMRILEGAPSYNPYHLAYAALLGSVAPDPINAHIVLRIVAALGSMLGLYAVLRAFALRPWACALASLAWGVSSLAMPSIQGGNNSIICLALTLPALGWLLHRPSLASAAGFALAAFWAAQVRPEYYAALVLVTLWGVWAAWRAKRYQAIPAVLLLAALGASFIVAAGKRSGPPMEAYLLLGLGQCYAEFYKREHPQAQFHAGTEYQNVLDETFGHPKTFSEALANNPREAARYFLLNGLHNLGQLALKILKGNNDLRSATVLLLLIGGIALGVRRASFPWEALPLLLFASASSVAIVLLNQDPRYWASFVPLAYLLLAWAVSQVSGRRALLAIAWLVFALPTFLLKTSNRDAVLAMREAAATLAGPPVIAGNFVSPFIAFAFSGRASAVNVYDGFDPQALRARRYDMMVFDGLDATAVWQANRAFFESFIAAPGDFGYRLLPGTTVLGNVYVRSS